MCEKPTQNRSKQLNIGEFLQLGTKTHLDTHDHEPQLNGDFGSFMLRNKRCNFPNLLKIYFFYCSFAVGHYFCDFRGMFFFIVKVLCEKWKSIIWFTIPHNFVVKKTKFDGNSWNFLHKNIGRKCFIALSLILYWNNRNSAN